MIIQPVDTGNKSHPYGHAIVAGIERYPSKITRRMSKTRQEKRSKIKPFIKVVNYNHLMPTRYTLELEGLKGTVSGDTFKEVSQREEAKKTVKKTLEERYTSGKNRWFFTPLSASMLPPRSVGFLLTRGSRDNRILIVSSASVWRGEWLGCIQHQRVIKLSRRHMSQIHEHFLQVARRIASVRDTRIAEA